MFTWSLVLDFFLGLLLKLPFKSQSFWRVGIEVLLLAVALIIMAARGGTLIEYGLIAYIFIGRRALDVVLGYVLPEATK